MWSERLLALTLLLAAACADASPAADRVDAARSAPAASSASASPADAELTIAARTIMAFLRGDTTFAAVRTADSVAFHVSPEGGGTRTVVARADLADRAVWVVPGPGGATYSLVPPADERVATVAPGTHFNCSENALSSRVPELGALPHVGVRLLPPSAGSCLESWNATFVFDPATREPTLIAVVYDQWEW